MQGYGGSFLFKYEGHLKDRSDVVEIFCTKARGHSDIAKGRSKASFVVVRPYPEEGSNESSGK